MYHALLALCSTAGLFTFLLLVRMPDERHLTPRVALVADAPITLDSDYRGLYL